ERTMDLYIHSSAAKISLRQSQQSIDDCILHNQSLLSEKSSHDHWYFDRDLSSTILIPTGYKLTFHSSNASISLLDFVGELDLNLVNCKMTILKGQIQVNLQIKESQLFAENIQGILKGSTEKSTLYLSSKFSDINLKFNQSTANILVHESEAANCNLQGEQSKVLFKIFNLDDLVLVSEFPEKSIHGKNSKYFATINGHFDSVQWILNSEEWIEENQELKVIGQDTIESNENIMELFNQFEDQIEADYEVFQEQDEISSDKLVAKTENKTTDDEHIYELYRKKEISFEELQEMLEKGM
ncbi:hypothetical protein MJH12_16615, partial [bacterium]|nr:hypothetical protein [bacterium]